MRGIDRATLEAELEQARRWELAAHLDFEARLVILGVRWELDRLLRMLYPREGLTIFYDEEYEQDAEV
jgi:hypothetical protein